MGNKRLSEEQIAEIIKLYQDGSTPTEIGKQFGIFNNSVTRILRKRGIERDQLIRMTQEQIDFMIKEYTNGVSLPYKVKYIGVDPMKKSVKSNQEIFDFLNTNVPMLNKEAEIICEGSENYCDPKYEGQVALAFSCPPYYNTEKYEEETSQAYFTGYNDFINIWWRKTMQNIMRLLKMNGIFILNVKEKAEEFNLAEDMCNVAREQGLKLLDTYQVQIARNAVFGNRKNIIKCEPLFIFERA